MAATNSINNNFNRATALKAFGDTKSSVMGLVDSGIKTIPQIFIQPPHCQLISNDRFKSVEHRVRANHQGPRVSAACFFTTSYLPSSKLYGPIYREITVQEYGSYFSKGLDGVSPLIHFKL